MKNVNVQNTEISTVVDEQREAVLNMAVKEFNDQNGIVRLCYRDSNKPYFDIRNMKIISAERKDNDNLISLFVEYEAVHHNTSDESLFNPQEACKMVRKELIELKTLNPNGYPVPVIDFLNSKEDDVMMFIEAVHAMIKLQEVKSITSESK